MREYAPLAAVVAAICVLVVTVYTRFVNPRVQAPIEIYLGSEVTNLLRSDKVEMKLVSAHGKANALVTRWTTKEPGKLLVRRFDGPRENVTYSYLVIYWSNGAATLHEIQVQLASQTGDLPIGRSPVCARYFNELNDQNSNNKHKSCSSINCLDML